MPTILISTSRWIVTAAAGLPLLLSACSNAGATVDDFDEAAIPEEDRYGGTVVIAEVVDLADLNPLTVGTLVSYQVIASMLFTSLVTANDELEYIPSLARSWELNADTTLLTFHLRDDVFWHDGLKTTAYDVAFSYERYRDPETAYGYRDRFFPYGEGEAVDSFTFQVRLRPHADFLAIWVLAPPVPRHILEDVPSARLRRHPFGTTQPIGNGPFRFVSRTPGQQWVFAANENFPEELGGRPYLDRVVYRVIPEPTTRLTELLTGGVDMVPISPFQLAQVEQAARVRAIPYRLTSTRIILWNTRRPLFADERVRRALTMAIDRQGIIDGIAYGHGDIANSFFPPFFWAHDPAAGADLRYSPESARRLLAEAGWEDRDGNGVLEDAAGREFRFALLWSQGSDAVGDVVEKIMSDLRGVGVVVEARMMDLSSLGAILSNSARDFDAWLGGYATLPVPDGLAGHFHCRNRDTGQQRSGICDAELDHLIDTIPRVMDRDAATPLWSAYQRRLAELQPYTFLYHPHNVVGVSDRLRNVHPSLTAYVGIARWWLVPDGRGPAAARQ